MNGKLTDVIISKIELLYKPTQSGKTFESIEYIKNDDESVHIFYVGNNLNEVNQLSKRIEEKLPNKSTTLSSKSNHKYKVWSDISTENKNIIIMCNNNFRRADLEYLSKSIKNINKKIKIYIDEADERFTPTIKMFNEEIINRIDKIIFITATPNKIVKKIPKIKLFPLENIYNNKKYTSLKDCKFKIYDDDNDNFYGKKNNWFIKEIINKYPKDILKRKNVIFCPIERKKREHKSIKDKIFEEYGNNHEISCLIVNGEGWQIFTDKKTSKTYELKNIKPEVLLKKIYTEHKLKRTTLFITGLLCIVRGITFTSKYVQITHGIFPHNFEKNKDFAYQLAGRLTGNNKKYLKSKPTIYCTKKFKDIVLTAENKAMNQIL
jgi:hypothetical protein